jgi:hypothetical protein
MTEEVKADPDSKADQNFVTVKVVAPDCEMSFKLKRKAPLGKMFNVFPSNPGFLHTTEPTIWKRQVHV